MHVACAAITHAVASRGNPEPPPCPRCAQIYNCEKLRLLLVGPQVGAATAACCQSAACRPIAASFPLLLAVPPLAPAHPPPPATAFPYLQLKHSISALACKGDLTFAAVRRGIVECKRVHVTGEYRGGHEGDILQVHGRGGRVRWR